MSSAPRDENRKAGLIAKSDADNTPVIIEADAATKRLKVSAVITSGGGGGTQYTDGDAAVTHPIGTIPVFNNAGTITAVSAANPLPVSATISTATLATSALQTTGNTSLATIATNTTTIPSVPSTNNSSSTPLAGNAVFTGTSDDCINYSEIRVTVFASHASATDGLSIQQSSDNSNWDITDAYTIAATTGKTFVVPRQARYLRVVYTNGATLQTSFRLQTILNRTGTTPSSQRASDAYTNETDLQEVWAFNSVWNGATWDRLPGTTTGVKTVLQTQTDTVMVGGVNIKEINAVTPLMGNGITGTGSQRVTIASDNSAISVNAVALTTILNGKTTVTTAGTRVTLAGSTTVRSITIKALATNTGTIYVGNNTVASTNGLQLAAGDSISLDIANLNTVNIDASINGEGVTYLGVN